jgi:catalase
MDAHGINTYRLTNSQGQSFFCKFHLFVNIVTSRLTVLFSHYFIFLRRIYLWFQTNQGAQAMDPNLAVQLAGTDPNYFTRDLYNSIASGQTPSWSLSIQVMTEDEATRFQWNPFDPTKV